jgi:hypothetical protein
MLRLYTTVTLLALAHRAVAHYCSNHSNGFVPPLNGQEVVDLCGLPSGRPIPVAFREQSGHPDRIYQFGGTNGTTWMFATCGFSSDVDTGLSIWKNTTDGMELVDCDDDSCLLFRNASSIVFTAPDDATYLLRPWIYDGTAADFAFGYSSGGGCGTSVVQNLTVPDCAPFTLVLRTDAFSNETSFVLKSVSTGAEVLNYPESTLYRGFHKYVKQACLSESECYELTVSDRWADGICCYSGLGSYEAVFNGQQVASGGSFGEAITHRFGNCDP